MNETIAGTQKTAIHPKQYSSDNHKIDNTDDEQHHIIPFIIPL